MKLLIHNPSDYLKEEMEESGIIFTIDTANVAIVENLFAILDISDIRVHDYMISCTYPYFVDAKIQEITRRSSLEFDRCDFSSLELR